MDLATLTHVCPPRLAPTTTMAVVATMVIADAAVAAVTVVVVMTTIRGCSIHGPDSRPAHISSSSTNPPYRTHGS
jgi:hypothetical protein